ncbi:hypothetical protein L798_03338 [Zootermopsis nevadensis]|uniref:Uncharacterized protein n=1 Tax=Zootermopsis nevadensis TaxID=136037 RepID=A0A067RDE8_ZOONE|nr:hypothetical protein L798_03338 [Zootermopsis nevadensis]
MPAISIVYFPVSSTLGVLMINLYTSFSLTNLYFDPENITSFRKNHFGLELGLENIASNTTFLSFPSFACWSTKGFKKDSCF